MAGLGYILLAVFYLLIDVLEIWNGGPFIYPGKLVMSRSAGLIVLPASIMIIVAFDFIQLQYTS